MNTTSIIDIHSHVYPQKIAQKAASATAKFYDYRGKVLAGSAEELLELGQKAGIGLHVVCSVATRPDQVRHINEFIAAQTAAHPGRLLGFGTLHPGSDQVEQDFDELVKLGLRGVKLHPDMQGFRLDDPACAAIYRACAGRLPLLIHTGDKRFDFSNPNRLIPVLTQYPNLTVIAAHFGGYTIWEAATRQLAGRFENLYVDCSSSLFAMSGEAAAELIGAYGADRVLFGTDYPMWEPAQEVARFRNLHLPESVEQKILHDNAARLLGL